MGKFNRIIVRPYSSECGGARDVVEILRSWGIDSKRVYSTVSYHPEPGDLIVNWGASYPPDWACWLTKDNKVLNHWESVANSVSKIRSFENFKGDSVPTPKWTLNQSTALKWSEDGKWVCCRTTERGYDGAGLVLAKRPGQMVFAPLYTEFIEQTVREYRAYIVNGVLIDLLYKYPPTASKVKSDVIRTESNGWKYGRNFAMITPEITKIAQQAIKANRMDFGGVDIIEDADGKLYALETNSEPGIGLITAQRLAAAFRQVAGL